MDEIDQKIINMLKENARKPFLQIAKELGMSEGAIRKRVDKLVKKNTIRRFTIQLTNESNAIIEVKTDPRIATDKISDTIKELTAGRIFEVAGRFDILCLIKTENLKETNNLVEKIRSVEGVLQTETFPILRG